MIPYHNIPSSRRTGIMLCYPFEQKRLEKWNPPYIVQPKLDGERCRAVGKTMYDKPYMSDLLSSEENSFAHTVPHIAQAYARFLCGSSYFPELDGELYKHGLTFEEIHSIVSTSRVSLHPDYQKIEFHYFDLIQEGSQYRRLDTLNCLNLPYPFVKVPIYIAEDLKEIMACYHKILDQGYEGIVVRHIDNLYIRRRSTLVMKFKPKKSDIYPICGWNEEISNEGIPKGRIGSIDCVKDGQVFSVSAGLDDETKAELWKIRDSLVGKQCKVWYQTITSGRGVPKFVSKIEILERDPGINPLINFSS